ncbi:MAG TPA: hypothetical protein VFH36_08180 [Acidimicrobiales bacterium]|nr:hypothetical protein [Acidimicrobiales bacterium]
MPIAGSRVRRAAWAVVAMGTVVPACGGSDGPGENSRLAGVTTTTAPAEPAGLSGTLQRSTLFETRRSLLLEVRTDAGDDRVIGAVQLGSPLFEPVEPEVRDAVVPASGRPVAVPLPFGTARCDTVAEAPAELVTDVDGEEVRVELEEVPAGLLAALHDAECAAAAVLEDVDIRLGDEWEQTAPRTVSGDIEVVQRNPGVTATVEEVAGNVIFSAGIGGAGAALQVSDEVPSARAGLVIRAARCDPHALTEYKRTFILTARVRVGEAEPVRVDLAAEGAARRTLEDLLTQCLE